MELSSILEKIYNYIMILFHMVGQQYARILGRNIECKSKELILYSARYYLAFRQTKH